MDGAQRPRRGEDRDDRSEDGQARRDQLGGQGAGHAQLPGGPRGNLWFASLGESDEGFYVYDPTTAQFRSYKYPLPAAYPAGSKALRDHAEGDPMPPVRAGLYDVKVDSTGKGWGVTYSMGMIVSVDPKTGEHEGILPARHAAHPRHARRFA